MIIIFTEAVDFLFTPTRKSNSNSKAFLVGLHVAQKKSPASLVCPLSILKENNTYMINLGH